jgi:hypothetical protein
VAATTCWRAGPGDDQLLGGYDYSVLAASERDTLWGGEGNDSLDGASGDDLVEGGDGADTLLGSSGNDTLLGGSGTDRLSGFTGADVFDPGDLAPGLDAVEEVEDFNADQGDLIRLGGIQGHVSISSGSAATLPLLWNSTPIVARSSPTLGLSLPGASLGTEVAQGYWVPSLSGGGWIVLDADADLRLSGGDAVLRVASTTVGLTPAHFVAGTFWGGGQAGTAGADTLSGTAAATMSSALPAATG